MMFALNFMAVRLSQKSSLSNLYNPYKKPNGGEGRGGEEPDFSRRENVPLFGLQGRMPADCRKPKFASAPERGSFSRTKKAKNLS